MKPRQFTVNRISIIKPDGAERQISVPTAIRKLSQSMIHGRVEIWSVNSDEGPVISADLHDKTYMDIYPDEPIKTFSAEETLSLLMNCKESLSIRRRREFEEDLEKEQEEYEKSWRVN